MALKVKDITKSTELWSSRASGASDLFAAQAEASAELWASNTAKAKSTFAQAITTGNVAERWARGVAKAGAAKFARKIRDVAAGRFSGGVAAATADYTAGAGPYYSTLASLSLDQRKPRGDPANYRRVEQVGKALNAKRLAMLGAGGA